mmetsp:Transcript_45978/g.92792  ORF Transcript_45978/g.92792 Transcript_45978/m.92792 type:complete len:342 (+) Transcript_45978:38-1063(+)
MVNLLVQHGANPNPAGHPARGLKHGQTSLLHWACGCGNLDAARALAALPPFSTTSQGAQLSQLRDASGATLLHWAAAGVRAHAFGSGGHPEVCAWLLESGVDANAATSNGNTVLMWSVWGGNQRTAALLVGAGADPLATNANRCGVSHWAAGGSGGAALCSWLRGECKVNFRLRNGEFNLPLTKAVAHKRYDVVNWLLEDDSESVQVGEDVDSEHSWEAAYAELRRFQGRFGHCLVPQDSETQVGGSVKWAHRQRAARGGRLSADREARLSVLGFEWDPYVAEWEELYARALHESNERTVGDFSQEIASWLLLQRDLRKMGELSDQRADRLKTLTTQLFKV